jgi:hypothetical protein
MSTRTLLYCGTTFFAAFWCVAVDPHITKGSEIVDKIVQDWQRRQELRGFRYLIAGTRRTPKGSLAPSGADPLPPADVVNDEKIAYFVDLERNRTRVERDSASYDLTLGRFARSFSVFLFDGRQSQTFRPRDRNPDLFDEAQKGGQWRPDLELESSNAPTLGRTDLAVLLAHGMVPLPGQKGNVLSPTQTLRRTLAPEMFSEYGQALRDGQACIVLRSQPDRSGRKPSFRELWVDVGNGSTVVRYVRYIGDSEEFQIDMWYEEGESRGYPLTRYTYMEAVAPGKLLATREMSVVDYEPEPAFADSLFYVTPQPGYNVYDWRVNRKYRVGLPGQPDRDLVELMHDRKPRNWTRLALVAFNVALLLGSLFCVFHYRKRRKG